MSSSIDEIWSSLYASNPRIKALAVVESSEVVWQTTNWNIVEDAPTIIESATNQTTSITQGDATYSRVDSAEDYYVGTTDGNGHLLVAMVDDTRWLIAWAAPETPPELAMVDLRYHAISLAKRV